MWSRWLAETSPCLTAIGTVGASLPHTRYVSMEQGVGVLVRADRVATNCSIAGRACPGSGRMAVDDGPSCNEILAHATPRAHASPQDLSRPSRGARGRGVGGADLPRQEQAV